MRIIYNKWGIIEVIVRNAIHDFIRECEAAEDINLINFALIQGDNILAQFCKKPYKEDCKQILFSMTKSFTSLAVGIAYDKGLLNPNDYVISYFAEELPEKPDPRLNQMRISHLLTMTSGIHDNTYMDLLVQSDWIKAFLAQDFPHEPGSYYRYSTHATHMLSAVIEKVSGQNLADFLNTNMFYPMEITDSEWEHSPEGYIAGGMGLSLCPSDLIKVAMMLLNKGVYNGQRIISEEYLSLATSSQVVKQDEKNKTDAYFSGFEYGYQFHVMPNDAYRADGAFGQFCIIHLGKKIAVIATSQRTKPESFLSLVDKYLLSSSYLSDESMLEESLNEYLQQLSFIQADKKVREEKPAFPRNSYRMEDNALNINFVKFSDDHVVFEYACCAQDEIKFDFNKPVYGRSRFIKDLQIHLQEHCVYANWPEDNTIILTVYYIETPYVAKYSFDFNGDKFSFNFSVSVSFSLKDFSVSGFPV